jgi:hypothetical protein
MKKLLEVGPLKLLQGSSCKELGKGNLGVLISLAGLGKTSCLIHIALDKIFRGEKLVHVSLKDTPDKVSSYYNVILHDLAGFLDLDNEYEIRNLLDKNRIILTYLKESFSLDNLKKNINNLTKEIDYSPDILIVDGVDFSEAERGILEGFLEIAEEFQMEVWFSALPPGLAGETGGKEIPAPFNNLCDLFGIIIQLVSTQSGVFLKLLKDHDSESVPDTLIKLDPQTFLVQEK